MVSDIKDYKIRNTDFSIRTLTVNDFQKMVFVFKYFNATFVCDIEVTKDAAWIHMYIGYG